MPSNSAIVRLPSVAARCSSMSGCPAPRIGRYAGGFRMSAIVKKPRKTAKAERTMTSTSVPRSTGTPVRLRVAEDREEQDARGDQQRDGGHDDLGGLHDPRRSNHR